ncbi:type II secretion system protein N [Piscinibacter gummiphilus]|uniref:type II secretion system protein N n=1 Tax=Piscinibacter gummiphilus TaxID=946333 RepID=UPI000A269954|nr:type II secretion system protein N [Piscinibacter gummiphilus]ATU64098.1 general secretion pathway protein GspN [Piscinibacter gummiphilus]GLS92933.1 general secretory pathway protein GspN [Piscinibacter gummiphilus]
MARKLVVRRIRGRRFVNSMAPTGWGDSTLAETAWERSRSAASRWAIAGVVVGVFTALVVFAPAEWLARMVASGTSQRVLLSDARGTLWSGSAVVVLTGGPGSRDATALPGRFEWTLGLAGTALSLKARHDCCLNDTVTMRLKPGFGRMSATLVPPPGWVGQWPSALLSGLGTPFNTLQLGGRMRVLSPGLTVEWVQGRVIFDGALDVEVLQASSRLTTLDTLGSYRFSINGNASRPGEPSQVTLVTTEGALKLSGSGTWSANGLRFRGEATATENEAAALSNLLNIIGRRSGARSVISIG